MRAGDWSLRYLTADWHIGLDAKHDADILRGVREIADHMAWEQKRDENLMIEVDIAGDIFDKPRPSPHSYEILYDCLFTLLEVNANRRRINIFPGNHDNTTGQDGAFDAFRSEFWELGELSASIRFITEPQGEVEPGTSKFVVRWPFGALPTGDDIRSMRAADSVVAAAPAKYETILVTHFDVPGAESSSEREIQIGNVGALPILSDVELVLSGHIHKHQWFKIGKARGMYPGALARVSHTEGQDPKGFIVIRGNYDEFEFVERTTDRVFVTLNIDTQKQPLAAAIKALKKPKNEGAIRIRIKTDRAGAATIDRREIERQVRDLGWFDTVKVEIEVEQETRKAAKAVAKGRTFDTYDKRWVKENIPKAQQAAALKRLEGWLAQTHKVDQQRKYHDLRLSRYRVKDFQAIRDADLTFGPDDAIGIMGRAFDSFSQSNGTGKSSLMEGLRFGFHGKTRFSKQASAIRDGADSAEVIIDLVGEGAALTIERAVTAAGGTAVVRDGDTVLAKGKEVTQWVELNLGLSLKAFDNIVYYGSNRHGIIGAQPTERLKTLQEPLPLDRYGDAQKLAQAEKRELERIVTGARALIADHEGDLLEPDDLEQQQEIISTLPDQIKKLAKEIEELKAEIAKHAGRKQTISILERTVQDLDRKVKHQDTQLKVKADKLASSKKAFSELPKPKGTDKLTKELDKLQAELRAKTEARTEARTLVKTLREKADKLEAGVCPVCDAKVTPEHVEHNATELANLIESGKAMTVEIEALEGRISKLETEIEAIEADEDYYDDLQITIAELTKEIEATTATLSTEQDSLAKAQAELEPLKKAAAKHSTEVAEQKVGELKEQSDTLTAELREAESMVERHTAAEAKLKIQQEKLDTATKELTTLVALQEAISPRGIPSLVVQSVIEEINDAIPGCIEEFDFWQPLSVWAEPTDDGGVAIFAQISHKPVREYEGLSQGEREIVNFVFTAAYRKVLQNLIDISYSFVLCDESIDALDSANQHKIISYFKRSSLQALCITHSDLKDSFTNMAVVTYDGKASSVAMLGS